MNQLIEERIEIINQLNSTLTGKGLSLEKRIKRLRIWGFSNYVFINLLLIFLISVSFFAVFHIEPLYVKWIKTGLLVSMTMSLTITAHFSIVELLVSKHLKNLQDSDFTVNQELNIELENLINNLNHHQFKPYWINIPSLIISIAALFKYIADRMIKIDLNPYWKIFPLPVLIFSILLFWDLNNKVYLLRKNIEKVESKTFENQTS